MLIAGVDEAGRGCVIGPLVIAGILMKEENLPFLTKLGVKDSKLLSPKKRQVLSMEIARLAENHLIMRVGAERHRSRGRKPKKTPQTEPT